MLLLVDVVVREAPDETVTWAVWFVELPPAPPPPPDNQEPAPWPPLPARALAEAAVFVEDPEIGELLELMLMPLLMTTAALPGDPP